MRLTVFIFVQFFFFSTAFLQTTPSICIVTAEGVDAENYRVYWNVNPSDLGSGQIDSIYIYRREYGALDFTLINALDNGISNSYLDMDVATDVVNQYAIAYKFLNGTVSPRSKFHQPGVLTYDPTFQGGGGENGGFAISQYVVEDLNQSGNYWDFLDSLKGIRVDNSGGQVVDLYSANVWENAFTQTEFVIDLFNEAPNSPFQGAFVFDSIIGQCQSFFRENINTSRTNIKKKPEVISGNTTYTPSVCLVSSSQTSPGNYVVYWDSVPASGGQPWCTVDSVLILRKFATESVFTQIGAVPAGVDNYFIDQSSFDTVLTKYRVAFKFQDGVIGEPSKFHQASVIDFYENLPSSPDSDGMVFSNYVVEGVDNITDYVSQYQSFYKDSTMPSFELLYDWTPILATANEFSTVDVATGSDVYLSIIFDSVVGGCENSYYRENINTSRTNVKRKVIVVEAQDSTSSLDEFDFYISISPNPVDDYLTIKLEDVSKIKTIALYDASGKLARKKTVQSSVEVFDLTNLKSGVYILYLKDFNGNLSQLKIVKR